MSEGLGGTGTPAQPRTVRRRVGGAPHKLPWHSDQGHVVVEAAELLLVLEGIDVTQGTRRKRWSPIHAA